MRRFHAVAEIVVLSLCARELVGHGSLRLHVRIDRLKGFLPRLLAFAGRLVWFPAPTIAVALPLTHKTRLEHKRREVGNCKNSSPARLG